MNSQKEAIFEYIENSKDKMVDLQKRLTSVVAMAPENGGEGEWSKVQVLLEWLKSQGLKQIDIYEAPDKRAKGGSRPSVIATIPGEDDSSSFWIMTHTDVVPPGELSLWQQDPFKVVEKDGRLYGRGVEDNQQGLVSSVFAALAMVDQGIVPKHTVKLLFVADEEVGSDYGIKYLLKEHDLFKKGDVILVPDGGEPDSTMIEVAEKSLIWLKFTTKGVQCHGSMPHLGKNAFLAASDLVMRLHGLHQEFPQNNDIFNPSYSTFVPSKKEANVPNINTVPGEDVFYLDCRILPETKVEDVLASIDRHINSVEKAYGVTIDYKPVQRVTSVATPSDAGLVKSLQRHIKEVYGTTGKPVGVGGGTVASYLRNDGYETVVWSTLEETCHQPNEYCVIANMIGDAKIMALLMLEGHKG